MGGGVNPKFCPRQAGSQSVSQSGSQTVSQSGRQSGTTPIELLVGAKNADIQTLSESVCPPPHEMKILSVNIKKNSKSTLTFGICIVTRNSGHYMPFFLALAEGTPPFGWIFAPPSPSGGNKLATI